MNEVKSALDWRTISTIPDRPNYFRGFVKHGTWSASISALRSWQHKESRRSTENDMTKLLQCIMLQASKGYILTPFQYFLNTIIPEDIGLANPHIIPPVSTCMQRWKKYFLPASRSDREKVWPMPTNIVQEALSDLYKTCEVIANSPKNRFVPSLITIAIMHHVKNSWTPKLGWTHRLKKFQHDLTYTLKNKSTDNIEFLLDQYVRPLSIAMEDCLLYINWCKAQNKLKKTMKPIKIAGMYHDLLLTFRNIHLSESKESIVSTILTLNKYDNSRLWYYTILLILILPEIEQSDTLKISENIDLDNVFATLFPAQQSLPIIPDYALDKHVGRPGGYERFQTEGIYVPPEKIWQPELNQKLSDEAFQLRFDYEEKHGKNSSKTQKVIDKLVADKPTKRPRPEEEKTEETKTLEPLNKRAAKESRSLPKMQPIFNVPVGQPVTGRFKKYVYIYKDYVKKGPYLKKDQEQIDYILKSTQYIHLINQQQGIDSTVIFPTVEKQEDGSCFLCWKNLGKYEAIQTEIRTTKLAENVTVASRKSFIYRASDESIQSLSEELTKECLNHLYARFIVGVGDSGLWNILIEDRSIGKGAALGKVFGKAVGIDLEEKRKFSKVPTSKIECLFSKIYHTDFWKSRVAYVKPVSLEWAQKNLEPAMIERVKLFSNLTE